MSIQSIHKTSVMSCVVHLAFMCVQETSKPAFGNSLRILTAVIAGMRHWSQFKDRVPYLLEIFGQLKSVVVALVSNVYDINRLRSFLSYP